MVDKNFVKTAISGLLSWADRRFLRLEISEGELINLLSELDIIDPVTNSEGDYYTNSSGQIYIL